MLKALVVKKNCRIERKMDKYMGCFRKVKRYRNNNIYGGEGLLHNALTL
jgi:hypothetical protein